MKLKNLLRVYLIGFVASLAFTLPATANSVQSKIVSASGKQADPEEKAKARSFFKQALEKLEARQYNEAIADFNQAVSLDPYFAEAYITMGVIQFREGDQQIAIKDFQKSKEIFRLRGETYKVEATSWLEEYYQKIFNSQRQLK